MLSRRIAVHFRRFRRELSPVDFAQTKYGAYAAVILLGLWQTGGYAVAAEMNSGSSQDDYVRLDWEYDLENGTGVIGFQLNPDLLAQFAIGGTLDLIIPTLNCEYVDRELWLIRYPGADPILLSEPTSEPGSVDGIDATLYSLNDLTTFGETRYELEVSFDEGMGLAEASVEYEGGISAASLNSGYYFDERIPKTSLDFVTVRPIPEPSSAAALGIGAAVAGLFGRRRR